jgi:hypothetical protein
MKNKILTLEEFNALTPAKKRVAIAKDVITQLDAKRISANTGSYITSEILQNLICNEEEEQSDEEEIIYSLKSLKELLPTAQCTVCAKGALFVADVCIRNEVSFTNDESLNKINEDDFVSEKLNYFSRKQLDLIEVAYEGYSNNADNTLIVDGSYIDEYHKAREFWENFRYTWQASNDRMIAIMKNIIKNRGTFKP